MPSVLVAFPTLEAALEACQHLGAPFIAGGPVEARKSVLRPFEVVIAVPGSMAPSGCHPSALAMRRIARAVRLWDGEVVSEHARLTETARFVDHLPASVIERHRDAQVSGGQESLVEQERLF